MRSGTPRIAASHRRRGFSFLEMVIAVAISTVLLLAVMLVAVVSGPDAAVPLESNTAPASLMQPTTTAITTTSAISRRTR